ncbi:sigma-70 family RNA polymerase sigma factor [Streptomyces clavifer]|uniref:sigma-70 family RNA polymerase sigma factor n=1 Tax=Streptomyces clavifer TaxID=68188 RepID=UPI0033AD1796
MAKDAPPRWDRRMQQRLTRGEAAALGELYDRFAPLVHSQAHRMLDDEDAADLVTREVFHFVWENPGAYDPKQGSMRSWVAWLTHRRSVQRLRGTHGADGAGTGHRDALAAPADGSGADRQEADGPRTDRPDALAAPADGSGADARERELDHLVRRATVAARADYIVASMPAPLRAALELAYVQRRDYRQTAADLGVTGEEARRRLRLGLQLLATANTHPQAGSSPPGYGHTP